MADERDDEQTRAEDRNNQQPSGQQNQQPQGQQQNQQPTGQSGGQQPTDQKQGGGMSGQPIGGNDSNTGSGTTLSAGYTPPSDSQNQGQSATGQTQTSGDTVTAADQGTGSGGSSSGQSGGQSGGFVGSQREDSSEYLREGGGQSQSETDQAPDSPPTGTDFANQGRGAQDEESEETIHSSAGGTSPEDGSGKGGGSF